MNTTIGEVSVPRPSQHTTSTATMSRTDEDDFMGLISHKPVYGANTVELSCNLDEEEAQENRAQAPF
jgi:hypothetical protein